MNMRCLYLLWGVVGSLCGAQDARKLDIADARAPGASAVLLPDGRVLTVFYFNEPNASDRCIEGTVWTPPSR